MLLSAALGLAAVGLALGVEQRLDWLVWLLAGGLAFLAHRRTGSTVLRIATEAFVALAAINFDQASSLQAEKGHF